MNDIHTTHQALCLPGDQSFVMWEDKTTYNTTYYVDHAHPQAADENPGTADLPFKTINRAAQVLQPGEQVLVKSGVYREKITPRYGGESPEAMIGYAAAPGAKVVVKGSCVLPSTWTRSVDPHGEDYSFRLWQAPLLEDFFSDGAHPFNTPKASAADIDLMPWALRWKGRVPYTLPSGLVFENGRRMVQLATYEDLVRLPGTYWVDTVQGMLHIHPYADEDPNTQCYEITVRAHLFKPAAVGLGYIRLRGFIFEHAGNSFPRVGVGAVQAYGGHHWIIEDNVVRHCNSVGIEAGARVEESRVSTPEEQARVKEHPGGFILRRNTVYDCGTGGIQGHTLRDTLIANNHIHHIGWQDVERYWECAAIKTLCNTRTLVRGNVIHDVASASAIWLDWDNRHCRITQNVVAHIRDTHNGAVFIEASRYPNMIDHNLIWDTWQFAVNVFDTDHALICHNLIGHANVPVMSRVNTERSLHGTALTSKDNSVCNNLFIDNAELPVFEDPDNVCDYNVYASAEGSVELSARQNPAWDQHSAVVPLHVGLDIERGELCLESVQPLPRVPAMAECDVDFIGAVFEGESVNPGPIQGAYVGKVTFYWQRSVDL